MADATRDARGITHDIPRVVGHAHLHQHIAGKDLLLDGAPLAVLDLDLFLGRHDHTEDLILHLHRLDAMHEVLLNFILVARVGMDDVPTPPIVL
jgi:hypothetical protein